jgi:glycosyltransferase 2 family protein
MKLAARLSLSLAMLALCTWLVWPDAATRRELAELLRRLDWATAQPFALGFVALSAVMHFARAWRLRNLLAPLGIAVAPAPLLAISSVGFFAIMALPARLGEFVRPGLLRRHAGLSASAGLGTVAVERVVDGLLVSLFVFGACFALRGPAAPTWMMPMAYLALLVFAAALSFLLFALRWPRATVALCLRASLLQRLAPRLAARIEGKLLELIRGFSVLRDGSQMLRFLAWSVLYWGANGLALWVLAGLFLPLSLIGAFGTMGVVAVGITLPNSPGLVGQFQWLTMLGLSLYLPAVAEASTPLHAQALAFAITHHAAQVLWYGALGVAGMLTPWGSLAQLRAVRKVAPAAAPADDAA